MAQGVIADIAGFACALFHRNTPYVILATSIVAGIDAGPSPRTCCDGQGYKNAFGAFHPPVVTLTDRTLWTTMLPGMIAFLVNQVEEDASLSELTLPPPSPLATRGLVVFWAGIASHVHRRVGWYQG